jgi:hypothetical protein
LFFGANRILEDVEPREQIRPAKCGNVSRDQDLGGKFGNDHFCEPIPLAYEINHQERFFSTQKQESAWCTETYKHFILDNIDCVQFARVKYTKKASLWNPILKKMQSGTFKNSWTIIAVQRKKFLIFLSHR